MLLAPIVHPKMNTGKEPFKCGMESADCGVRPNLISVIAQLRSPSHALRCHCGIWNAERVLRFSGERLFLPANDAGERAKRVVHGIGVGEDFGHVRLQHHHVCAALEAAEILAAHALRKIIFRPQAVIG